MFAHRPTRLCFITVRLSPSLFHPAGRANTIFINGSYWDAEVTTSGTSKVFLAGLNPRNGTAQVTATGISTVWIQGGPGGSQADPLDAHSR